MSLFISIPESAVEINPSITVERNTIEDASIANAHLYASIYNNGSVVKNHYPIYFEDLNHPSLMRLRDVLALDLIAALANSDIELAVLVKDAILDTLPVGNPIREYHPIYDPNDMLYDASIDGDFLCHHLATMYIQSLASIGIVSRGINVLNRPGDGHALNEVWIDDLQKWVAVDLYNDAYFVFGDVPLSALELMGIVDEGFDSTVVAIRGTAGNAIHDSTMFRRLAPYFKNLAFMHRTDFRTLESIPHWHPRRNHVFTDVLWGASEPREYVHYVQRTTNLDAVYFPLNQVHVRFDTSRIQENYLGFVFDTETPWFNSYIVSINDSIQCSVRKNYWAWEIPKKGSHELKFQARNAADRTGPETIVKVTVAE